MDFSPLAPTSSTTPDASLEATACVRGLFAQAFGLPPEERAIAVALALRAAGVFGARAMSFRASTTFYGPGEDRPYFMNGILDHSVQAVVEVDGVVWDPDGLTNWTAQLLQTHPRQPLADEHLYWLSCFKPTPKSLDLSSSTPRILDGASIRPEAFPFSDSSPSNRLHKIVRQAIETHASYSGNALAWMMALATHLNVQRQLPTELYSTTRSQSMGENITSHDRRLTLEVPGTTAPFATFHGLPVGHLLCLSSSRPGHSYKPGYADRKKLAFRRWPHGKGADLLELAVEAATGLYPLETLAPSRPRPRM